MSSRVPGLEEKRGNLTSEKISTAVFFDVLGYIAWQGKGRLRCGCNGFVWCSRRRDRAEKIGRGSGNLWCDSLLGVGILRSSEEGGC